MARKKKKPIITADEWAWILAAVKAKKSFVVTQGSDSESVRWRGQLNLIMQIVCAKQYDLLGVGDWVEIYYSLRAPDPLLNKIGFDGENMY